MIERLRDSSPDICHFTASRKHICSNDTQLHQVDEEFKIFFNIISSKSDVLIQNPTYQKKSKYMTGQDQYETREQ